MQSRLWACTIALWACLHTGIGAQAENVCTLASGGIGGTGAPAAVASSDDSDLSASEGIGGTGVMADEGGIGGTGIVGVITGFGSICVAGLEIHYGTRTPITFDNKPMMASDLKIGHVVQVQARGLGDSVRATAIELVPVVSGPVGKIDAASRRVEVLGQSVRVTADALTQVQQAKDAGHPVLVSGMRSAKGDIVATRVDPAPDLKQFGVTGPVAALSRDSARIGDLQIKLDREQSRGLEKGQVVEICGVPENGALRARTIEEKGAPAFKGRLQRVVLEGFVSELKRDRLRIDNTQVRINPDTRAALEKVGDLKVDQRVVVSMRVENGKFTAEKLRPIRDRDARGASDSGKNRDNMQGDSQSDKSGDSKQGSSGGTRDSSSGGSDHGTSGSNSGSSSSGSSSGDRSKPDQSRPAGSTSDRSSSGGSERPSKPSGADRPSGSGSHGGRHK